MSEYRGCDSRTKIVIWIVQTRILICMMTAYTQTTLQAQPATQKELTVFAGASLHDVFTEIGRDYQIIHPEDKLIFVFAGSQQLARQTADGCR